MADRSSKIKSYGSAYGQLVEALAKFPRDMWDFRSPADPWTIHEIVVHITDSEANSYIRCRRLMAEPGSSVMSYDENGWASALHYSEQSTEVALELFRWLRQASYELIKTLPDAAWSNTIHHPENGTMTMDDWLDVYERHIPEHIAQMQAIYDAWKASLAINES